MGEGLRIDTHFWDEDASKYIHDRWESKETLRFDKTETLSFIEKSFQGCNGRLLDAGCGPGYWLRQRIWPSSSFQVGVDSSARMIRLAGQSGSAAVLADAHSLPFQNDQFDAVLAVHVLEYSFNPQKFLSEMRRVLCPGGRCCIITKNKFGKPWRLALWVSERISENPLRFNCLSVNEMVTEWGERSIRDVRWLSARLITDLNDVNDAVRLSFPRWVERFFLAVAIVLRPLLVRGSIGKSLAWHVGILLEK